MGGVEQVPVDRYGRPIRDDRLGRVEPRPDRRDPRYPPDPRSVDPRSVDPRSVDPRVVDPRGVDPRAVDPRVLEARAAEARAAEVRAARRAAAVRQADARGAGVRQPDTRDAAVRQADARDAAARAAEVWEAQRAAEAREAAEWHATEERALAERYAAEADSAYYRRTRPSERGTDQNAGRHRAGSRPYARAGRRRTLPLWQEIPLLLIVAFVLATVIKTFVVQAFYIPSGSMEQTLLVSDRVLVNKFVYDTRDPRRGEIVVFRGTDSWAPEAGVQQNTGALATAGRMLGGLVGAAPPDEKDFVKRVIGTGGDVVQCCDKDGRVEVNGVSLVEPYIFEDDPIAERPFGPITVPPGRLFMMGDHRSASADSREYLNDQWRGTIPVEAVIGQAYATAWPASRWGLLQEPDTFGNVPTALSENPHRAARPVGAGALLVLPVLFGPFGLLWSRPAPRWLLRPDSRRRRRLRW